MRPGKALDIYLSRFRDKDRGLHDLLSVFQQVEKRFGCRRVLYPGSYLHVTPSLVFPEVCYVDSLKGFGQALADRDLWEYIDVHKMYPGKASIRVYQEDYYNWRAEQDGSFDLLISLNAGLISQACKRFLKPNGLLMVNDGHYDASRTYVDQDYRLVGAFSGETSHLETSDQELSDYFKTRRGQPFTLEMVEANNQRPPSKARFKPARVALAYLFQRTS